MTKSRFEDKKNTYHDDKSYLYAPKEDKYDSDDCIDDDNYISEEK